MIAQRSAGEWLQYIGFAGFLLVNFGGPFVALFWGLRGDKQAEPQPPVDRGAMTDAGVPYVPGPPVVEAGEVAEAEHVEAA